MNNFIIDRWEIEEICKYYTEDKIKEFFNSLENKHDYDYSISKFSVSSGMGWEDIYSVIFECKKCKLNSSISMPEPFNDKYVEFNLNVYDEKETDCKSRIMMKALE